MIHAEDYHTRLYHARQKRQQQAMEWIGIGKTHGTSALAPRARAPGAPQRHPLASAPRAGQLRPPERPAPQTVRRQTATRADKGDARRPSWIP